jgi:crotonobetainyl-CoA:carnitine CoA-transferase CaiB-like acyl-CoA transferase
MSETSARDSLATGLRVVEIGESIASALAGMVLVDNGAEVVAVEPPTGSRLRRLPAFRMWARGKRAERLDLTTPPGRRRMAELAGDADVVITGLEPAVADRLGVDGRTLCAADPTLVHCEITGFGRGHPLSALPGLDGVVTAAAGRAYEFSVLFGGERPAFPAVPVATYGAAMLALQGVFAALVERQHTGRGQPVATSLLGALGVFDLSGWAPGSSRALRLADVPMTFYPVARTSDGVWVQFSQNSPRLFRALLRAIELEHLYEEPRFRYAPRVPDPSDARDLRAMVMERVSERSWTEWQARFAADDNVTAEPLAWPGDALHHPQLVHTGDAAEVQDDEVGPLRWLGPLITCSATPAQVPARAADPAEVRRSAGWSGPPRVALPQGAEGSGPRSGRPLLSGVTVLEMATWIATPMAAALLAELGARVIKIEPFEGDPMRLSGPAGLKCVQGKESIILDLKAAEGREIVHRLAERSDVVVHNYRPGVPERLGIDYQTLRALNPRLVYLYAASYGSTGPMSARPAFHVTAGAVCGGALAQAGTGVVPGPDAVVDKDDFGYWSQYLIRCNESNPDFNAALAVAAAVTMALFARERTGYGQSLETRMMLSNAYVLSEHFVDYAGRPPRVFPDAGVHGLNALYRLYPAKAGWVFVAAMSDDDFVRLCHGVGRPRLPADPRFSDAARRAGHDGELSDELGAALAGREAGVWQDELTALGITCVKVHDGPHAAYIFDAPWGEALGFSVPSAASGFGPYPRYGRAVRTGRDLGPPGAADHAGAQTRRLLTELGYDEATFEKLLATGVVAEAVVDSAND